MGERRFARVLGYARVSSVDQALGTSLGDQQAAMTAYAAGRQFKVARFFVESESGIHEKIERREQMRALLATVRSGDLVLCDKIDRWSRDPEFTYRTMRELLAKGVSVYFVGEQCDPGTPEGDSMMGMRVLFAREEHKRIRQRLVGTRRLLRDKGLYVEGLPPLGYRRQATKDREARNVLIVEPTEADQVRRIFKACIQGKAIDVIADELDLKRDRVFDVLHRRLYLGEIDDAEGKWIRGRHPAIIDARTFQAAHDALAERSKGSRSPQDGDAETATWWLRDVARCGRCGAKMSAAYGGRILKGGRYANHYFRCSKRCGGRFLRVSDAEESMEWLVFTRLEELRDELGQPPAPVREAPTDLRERRAKLEKRREKYLEMHADGLTTRDELRTQLAKLDVARLKLDALEAAPPEQSPAERRAELKVAGRLLRTWLRMPPKDRRAVVNRVAVSVGLAVDRAKPVWRAADEVDLAGLTDVLVRNLPTKADDRAVAEYLGKLRRKAR